MFEVIIPYYNGQDTIVRLVESIPDTIKITIVEDHSDRPLPDQLKKFPNIRILRSSKKGYFTGAVNTGLDRTSGDVLILNQDIWFTGNGWITQIESALENGFSFIGERISGQREDWPNGYIHGTFMYITREIIDRVGGLNDQLFPMWGSTAEYQLRVARAGFKVLPLKQVTDFRHERPRGEAFGKSFKQLLRNEHDRRNIFVRTPPLVSVIIPCFNFSKFLPDTIHSLIGGATSLGEWPQQTFGGFEVIIVDDSSTDDTPDVIKSLCDPWKGVRSIRLDRRNVVSSGKYIGKIVALNEGIKAAYGKYILPLDADDMMKPDRIEKMLAASMDNPHSVVYDDWQIFAGDKILEMALPPKIYGYDANKGEYDWIDNPNFGQKTLTPTLQDYDFEVLIHKNQIHNSIMFEKSAWQEVGGYPDRFIWGRDDWAMNVRLGIAGYCGVHLKGYHGLLYRRENQNRTLENTRPIWMKFFYKQMKDEFPEIYKGDRPMTCCGRGRASLPGDTRTQAFAPSSSVARSMDVASEDTTLVLYDGVRTGSFSVWGFISGTQYRVRPGIPLAVRNEDLASDRPRQYPGILDMYEGNRKMFALVEIHQPEPTIEEEEAIESVMTIQDFAETEDVDLNILETNLTTLRHNLDEVKYNATQLTKVLAAELAGKNRVGAVTYIEEKIQELKENE